MGVDVRSFKVGLAGLSPLRGGGGTRLVSCFGLHLTVNLELERTGGIRLFN